MAQNISLAAAACATKVMMHTFGSCGRPTPRDEGVFGTPKSGGSPAAIRPTRAAQPPSISPFGPGPRWARCGLSPALCHAGPRGQSPTGPASPPGRRPRRMTRSRRANPAAPGAAPTTRRSQTNVALPLCLTPSGGGGNAAWGHSQTNVALPLCLTPSGGGGNAAWGHSQRAGWPAGPETSRQLDCCGPDSAPGARCAGRG